MSTRLVAIGLMTVLLGACRQRAAPRGADAGGAPRTETAFALAGCTAEVLREAVKVPEAWALSHACTPDVATIATALHAVRINAPRSLTCPRAIQPESCECVVPLAGAYLFRGKVANGFGRHPESYLKIGWSKGEQRDSRTVDDLVKSHPNRPADAPERKPLAEDEASGGFFTVDLGCALSSDGEYQVQVTGGGVSSNIVRIQMTWTAGS